MTLLDIFNEGATNSFLDQVPTKTPRHAFIECPEINQAWIQVNNLRRRYDLPQLRYDPTDILEGKLLDRPDLITKKFSSLCRVTKETPWDLLRCLILWNIWCQRYNTVMRNKTFHLGTAMHNAWRTVIQIGVATWRNIWKNPITSQHRKEVFQDTWTSTGAFCSMTNSPVWHFLPQVEYLPQDLALRPSVGTRRQQIQTIFQPSTSSLTSREVTSPNTTPTTSSPTMPNPHLHRNGTTRPQITKRTVNMEDPHNV